MKKLLLFLVFISFFGTSALAMVSGEVFLQGMEAFVKEDYSQAQDLFQKVIRMRDDWAKDAYYYMILSLFRTSNFQEARRAHEDLRLLGYDYANLYLQWGMIYMNLEGHWAQPDLPLAKEMLEKARDLGLDTGTLYGYLGSINYSLGHLQEALSNYQRAVLKNPTNSVYHSSLARVYQDLGKTSMTVHHLERSLIINPIQPGLMVNLGNLYFNEDRILDFKRLYRDAIDLEPERFSIRQEYGIRLYQLEIFDEALIELEKARDLNPKTYLPYFYLGKINEAREAYRVAISYYEEALKYNPSFSDAYLAIGDIFLEESPYRAMSVYYEALESSPNYVPALYRLARAYHLMGLSQSAIDQLLRTLEIDPNHQEAMQLLNELIR